MLSDKTSKGIGLYKDSDKPDTKSDWNSTMKKINTLLNESSGGVMSVNDIEPDESGNVEITGEDIKESAESESTINEHLEDNDTQLASILLEIGSDVISEIGTSIKNAIVNLNTLVYSKVSDILIDGASIVGSDKKANIPLASDTDMGIIRIATDREIVEGTDEDICINAKQMKDEIDDRVGGDQTLASRCSALENEMPDKAEIIQINSSSDFPTDFNEKNLYNIKQDITISSKTYKKGMYRVGNNALIKLEDVKEEVRIAQGYDNINVGTTLQNWNKIKDNPRGVIIRTISEYFNVDFYDTTNVRLSQILITKSNSIQIRALLVDITNGQVTDKITILLTPTP